MKSTPTKRTVNEFDAASGLKTPLLNLADNISAYSDNAITDNAGNQNIPQLKQLELSAIDDPNAKPAPPQEEPISMAIGDDEPKVETTDKLIDFEQHLEALKKRTELEIPYTTTQVEDAMYIDQNTIVTLEFHYYQNDCQYTLLERQKEQIIDDKLCDMNGNEVEHLLGTHKYDDEAINPNNMFDRKDIVNLQDHGHDVLEYQRSLGEDSHFTRVTDQNDYDNSNKDTIKQALGNKMQDMFRSVGKKKKKKKNANDVLIEGYVCLYKTNNKGGMQRLNQIETRMGRTFFKSINGNMTLTRSRDKRVVSMVNFDRNDPNQEYFKLMAWTIKLKPWPISQRLNDGLNEYFGQIKDTFDELFEISFVNKCRHLQLCYIETKPRTLKEQQDFERELTEQRRSQNPASHRSTKVSAKSKLPHERSIVERRNEPRKCKKYVFFDVETGQIAFSYGGVQSQNLKVKNINGDETELFELGIRIKEIKEDSFNSNVMFYLCGDLWSHKMKKTMYIHQWCFVFFSIDFELILSQGSQNDITAFLHESFRNAIPGGSQADHDNFFLFDQEWITNYYYEWENYISCSANRKFDTFSVIFQPEGPSTQSAIMINGPKYKYLDKDGIMEIPYYKKFPNEVSIFHGRNAIIKNEIFYNLHNENGISESYCIRMDHKEKSSQIMNFNINVENYVSQFDQWLQAKKNFSDKRQIDIAQIIHVTRGDQYGVLTTRIPSGFVGTIASSYITEVRKTKQYMFQDADHPFLIYNLGERKIVIQSTLIVKAKQPYILELNEDETFVNFVKVDKYEDIRFFPDDLRVECCSHFLLMVRKTGSANFENLGNRLYLLLIDPMYTTIQAALFKSNTVYDNDMFKDHDFHLRSIIQSNASRKNDLKYSTYIWTQTNNAIIRSKMLKTKGTKEEMEDSDNVLDEEELIEQEKVEDEFEFTNRLIQEKVYMQNDKKGFIYYVTQRDGECSIVEANPRDPYANRHYKIFTLKSTFIMGFNVIDENTFMIMDDQFMCFNLKRNQNNRGLHIYQEMTMKEIQRLDYKTDQFDDQLLNPTYSVFKSKIYYFYEERYGCFPTGIFEAESLMNQQNNGIKYMKGPFRFTGANRFYCVYSQNKFKTFLRIFQLPDQTQKTLINDFQNQVNMSTFITGGNILLRVKSRFMIFSNDGAFIDELQFFNGPLDVDQVKANQSDESFHSDPEQIAALKGMGKGKEKDGVDNNVEELQVYDFIGNPYDIDRDQPDTVINENNKMELLQFSFNNRYFLFTDLITRRIFVYEILEIAAVEHHSFFDLKDLMSGGDKQPKWKFVLKYEIVIKQSFLCKYMFSKDMDTLDYFRQNRTLIKIDDKARVKINFCEKISLKERKSDNEPEIINCKLIGAQFEQDGKTQKSKCYGYNQNFTFSNQAQENLTNIEQDKRAKIAHQLNAIRIVQTRWPKSLHDYTQYDTLLSELRVLENKRVNDIYAKCYFEDLLIIYCGNYLKFGRIGENKDIKLKKDGAMFEKCIIEDSSGEFFQPINFTFTEDTEIIKLIETAEKDVVQILAINYEKNIITIVTWDFQMNCEKSMYQIEPDEGDQVGNHVVKGMNYKFNYYIDQNHLTDLEYNIPIRQMNVNQGLNKACVSYVQQLKYINDLFNQRKINEDNKKFLGIEKAHCLYYDLSRMDILLWKNIAELGNDLALINQSVSLNSFNLVFDSISLFHYFAPRADILQSIKDKMTEEGYHRELTKIEQSLPLQILNPDQKNKTALYTAISNQSVSSFELMVEMLKGNTNICISKMMLKSLAMILTSDNPNMLSFFGDAYFIPPQMRIDQFVPWNDDMDQIVFPCHTSVISRELLLQKLNENGVEVDFEAFKGKSKGTQEYEVISKQQLVEKKKALRKFQLDREFDTGLPDGEAPLKKVKVQALDMDWLFENDNAKILIALLANDANSAVLTQRTISIFIQLMWEKYQIAIINKVFIPYIVYLMIICYLVCCLSSQFIINLAEPDTPEVLATRTQYKIIMACCSPISVFLMFAFGYLELKQVISDGLDYFSDPWNCIDISILYFNIVFLFMLSCCIILEHEFFPFYIFNMVGSFAAFFMWLKVFYWCRLFSNLAYYVKLIQQTIGDSLDFMLMVLIILISFGCFFIGADQILEKNEKKSYMAEYFNNEYIDSVMSVYMIGALGNFTTDRFRVGQMKYFVMLMFMMATFIVSVVFMNMLIAIMGDTFGQVLEGAEENGLKEQISLIDDHIWLLDIQKVFEGQKYILIVAPSVTESESKEESVKKIQEAQNYLSRCISNVENGLVRKMKSVQQDTNFQLANHYEAIKMLMGRLRCLDDKIVAQHEATQDKGNSGMTGSQIKKKQKEFAAMLNLDGGEMDKNNIREIAEKWCTICDTDNNGQISLKEFLTFFESMDGIFMEEEEIRNLFNAFDTNNSGELSIDEFANAIAQSIAPDQPESDDDNVSQDLSAK